MPTTHSSHLPCGISECMLCVFNIMTVYFNLMNASSSTCTESDKSMYKKHTRVLLQLGRKLLSQSLRQTCKAVVKEKGVSR